MTKQWCCKQTGKIFGELQIQHIFSACSSYEGRTVFYLEARAGGSQVKDAPRKTKPCEHLLVAPGRYSQDQAEEENRTCKGPYDDVCSGDT